MVQRSEIDQFEMLQITYFGDSAIGCRYPVISV